VQDWCGRILGMEGPHILLASAVQITGQTARHLAPATCPHLLLNNTTAEEVLTQSQRTALIR
jgi:hypothetical protein